MSFVIKSSLALEGSGIAHAVYVMQFGLDRLSGITGDLSDQPFWASLASRIKTCASVFILICCAIIVVTSISIRAAPDGAFWVFAGLVTLLLCLCTIFCFEGLKVAVVLAMALPRGKYVDDGLPEHLYDLFVTGK